MESVIDSCSLIVVVNNDKHFERDVFSLGTCVRKRDRVSLVRDNVLNGRSKLHFARADEHVHPFAWIGELRLWSLSLHQSILS